jgi:hypothetical protein
VSGMTTEEPLLRFGSPRELPALISQASNLEEKARRFLAASHFITTWPASQRDRLQFILFLFTTLAGSTECEHGRELADWLARIGREIDDLNDGVVSGTFARSKKKGRRKSPESSEIWCGRALIASGIDVLMASGRTRKDIETLLKGKAYKNLDSFAEDHGLPRSSDHPMSTDYCKRGFEWRNSFKNGKVKNHLACTIWDRRSHSGEDGEVFFKIALTSAGKLGGKGGR